MRAHPVSRRRLVASLALATVALVLLTPGGASVTTSAAADTDCVTSRPGGWAPAGCYALRPGSPYATAGLAGQRLGADADRLALVAACVAAGNHHAPECATDPPGESFTPPSTPSGLRIVPR